MDKATELLWQRDQCRAKCERLEQDNARLQLLLGYAEQAIEAEYQLRVRDTAK